MKGRSLELFFVDGNPDGMLTAEVFNWTGHVLRIPRTQLAEGLKRAEAKQTGVYILIGETDDGEFAYIGEAEDMASRLASHSRQKDWWNQAILITTAGDSLHKAHVRFLERRLVEIATDAAKVHLENGNNPGGASLNEAATSNMESFLETLKMVLPAIRVDAFTSDKRKNILKLPSSEENDVGVYFELTLAKHGIKAKAKLVGEELIVLEGSTCRHRWVGKSEHHASYAKRHSEMVSKGVIVIENDVGVFKENYAFSSPSGAAAIIAGRASNGRTNWRTAEGLTYAAWEEQQLREIEQ